MGMTTTAITEDPAIAIARATRSQRGAYAGLMAIAAVIAGAVGFFGWNASKPNSLDDAAHNAVVALARTNCPAYATDSSCGGSYIEAQPIWLYAGGAVAALFLLIALVLFLSRPAVPA